MLAAQASERDLALRELRHRALRRARAEMAAARVHTALDRRREQGALRPGPGQRADAVANIFVGFEGFGHRNFNPVLAVVEIVEGDFGRGQKVCFDDK